MRFILLVLVALSFILPWQSSVMSGVSSAEPYAAAKVEQPTENSEESEEDEEDEEPECD